MRPHNEVNEIYMYEDEICCNHCSTSKLTTMREINEMGGAMHLGYSWMKRMIYNGWQWLLLNTKFDFSGNEWKHDISFDPTQSTWRQDRHSGWNSTADNQLALIKWSRFTINKLLWTFERRRYVFGHHSHGPHATKMLRFREELKRNVKAQKHLLDTTAPN